MLTALLWAIAVILFKRGGDHIDPILLSLFKDVLAFLLFIPTALILGQPLIIDAPLRDWLLLVLSGICGIAIADTLYFMGVIKLGPGLASIVNCLFSPAVIVLSYFFLGESLRAIQLVGVAIILIGVIVATSRDEGKHLSRRDLIVGILMGLGAVIFSAGGIIIMKPIIGHSPIFWFSELRLAAGIAALLTFLLLHPRKRLMIAGLRNRTGFKYMFSGSFVGAYLALLPWAAGFKYGQASLMAALQQSTNLMIFILGVIFLGEPLSPRRISGIVLGLVGVFLVLL